MLVCFESQKSACHDLAELRWVRLRHQRPEASVGSRSGELDVRGACARAHLLSAAFAAEGAHQFWLAVACHQLGCLAPRFAELAEVSVNGGHARIKEEAAEGRQGPQHGCLRVLYDERNACRQRFTCQPGCEARHTVANSDPFTVFVTDTLEPPRVCGTSQRWRSPSSSPGERGARGSNHQSLHLTLAHR